MRSGLQHQYARYHTRPIHNLASMTCKKLHTEPIKIIKTPNSVAISRCNGETKVSHGVSMREHFWIISTPKFGFQYTAGIFSGFVYAIRYRGTFYSVGYTDNTIVIGKTTHMKFNHCILRFACNIPDPVDLADAFKKIYDYKLDQMLLNVMLCRNPEYNYEYAPDKGLLTHIEEYDNMP